jgi:hypothetical protein
MDIETGEKAEIIPSVGEAGCSDGGICCSPQIAADAIIAAKIHFPQNSFR